MRDWKQQLADLDPLVRIDYEIDGQPAVGHMPLSVVTKLRAMPEEDAKRMFRYIPDDDPQDCQEDEDETKEGG